jgi:hypothetical protein
MDRPADSRQISPRGLIRRAPGECCCHAAWHWSFAARSGGRSPKRFKEEAKRAGVTDKEEEFKRAFRTVVPRKKLAKEPSK